MKIEDVFYKLRPISGKQLDLLWQEYLVADPPLRKVIEKTLRVQLARRLGETYESEHVLLKVPPQELASGEYPIGPIYYGDKRYYEFGLKEEEFIQHIGIFGRSGSGKTNLAYLILQGLSKANKPFLVFDWKRNYRDLLNHEEFSDMFTFTVGRDIAPFRFNPLIPPPGTSATVWLKKLIEIMCHAYYLGEGVSILLLRAIDALYKQYGLYGSHPQGYPTIADVQKWLSAYKAKSREGSWMESAVRAVETLCFGEVGNVLNHGPFFDIPKLLERQVVLELDALANADKTFIIEALLLWIHHYRLAQDEREKFKHAIVIEEAHHILLRKKQETTGEEAVTDILLREIRELGESVICLDQHPSLISKPALGNTYTSFVFNLKHRGDITMMQDCLHLDSEQTHYLGRLEVGWAVVKLQGRWFFPFLIKLPLVSLKKGEVSDQDIQNRSLKLPGGSEMLITGLKGDSALIATKEGYSSSEKTPEGGKALISAKGKNEMNDKIDGKNGCAIKLTTQDKRLLGDIGRHPNSNVTERYSRSGISVRFGNDLITSLIDRGFISFSYVIFSQGRIKVLSLTAKGEKALSITAGQSDRHGGPEHRYWAGTIADHLKRQGYEVTEEAPVGGGKAIDIVATQNGKRIALEIETGKSDVNANVAKAISAGIKTIYIITTSTRAKRTIESKLINYSGVEVLSADEAMTRKNW